MTIRKFCKEAATAYKKWEKSDGDHISWLDYHETRNELMDELVEKFPQVKRIEHLWTRLYAYPAERWEAVLELWIQAIKKGVPCVDCFKLIDWRKTRCDDCTTVHQNLMKERREVAQIMNRKIRRKGKR